MQILAIELSSFTGSIAFADDNQVFLEAALPDDQRSAQSLVPAINKMASDAGWRMSSLDLICVTTGPGSFTSLRIGVITAKVLTWAVKGEVLGVNTLRAVAHRAFSSHPDLSEITTVMDAQRKQLFTGTFKNIDGIPHEVTPTAIADRQPLVDQLPPNAVISGSGIAKITGQLAQSRADVRLVDESLWQPTAVDVLQLALHDWNAGKREDYFKLVPQYYRQSAAEEKAAAQSE